MEPMESVDLADVPASSKATTPTDSMEQPDDQSTSEGLAPSKTAIPLWAISSEIHEIMNIKESVDWQNDLVDDLADIEEQPNDNLRMFCLRWGIHMGIIAILALISLIFYFCCFSSTSPVVKVAFVSKDCFDLHHTELENFDGIYTIFPQNGTSFQVHCDMITDGGGWTVFQRRIDHGLVFWNKSWAEYKHGFNNGLDRDYWLGLDKLNMLTNKDENVTLRIDIWGDRCALELATSIGAEQRNCSQTANGYWFGEWTFQVGNESDGYLLSLTSRTAGNLSGEDGGNFLQSTNEMMFSTIDNDNDMESERNCALYSQLGGWWYSNCTSSSLNGNYNIDEYGRSGFRWRQKQADQTLTWTYPLMSEMKLRRINIAPPPEGPEVIDLLT